MKLNGRSMRVVRMCSPSALSRIDSYMPGSPIGLGSPSPSSAICDVVYRSKSISSCASSSRFGYVRVRVASARVLRVSGPVGMRLRAGSAPRPSGTRSEITVPSGVHWIMFDELVPWPRALVATVASTRSLLRLRVRPLAASAVHTSVWVGRCVRNASCEPSGDQVKSLKKELSGRSTSRKSRDSKE